MLAEGKRTEKKQTRFQTKIIAEIIVLAALSAVLYSLRPFTLPYGGSLTLGSMVPTAWLSLRRGVYAGLIGGAISGLLSLFVDVILVGTSVIATPVQVILEYPAAFAVIGMTAMFGKKSIISIESGFGISVFLRFLIHYFVGVFIWIYIYSFPTEWGQYLWPLIYNGSFLFIEYIVAALILAALVKTKTTEYSL